MNDTRYAVHSPTARRNGPPQRDIPRPRGVVASGRIVKLLVGQGHGYIRLADRRDVYFHRGDVADASTFNAFVIGDAVAFELLEDRFSGPRALHVTRQRSRRP